MAIHISRRELMAALGSAALTWPLPPRQQSERMRRVGILIALPENDSEEQRWVGA
jgi:hypothetical protein